MCDQSMEGHFDHPSKGTVNAIFSMMQREQLCELCMRGEGPMAVGLCPGIQSGEVTEITLLLSLSLQSAF